MVNGTLIIKSGCDFKNFSVIKVHKNDVPVKDDGKWHSKWKFEVELKEVNHE